MDFPPILPNVLMLFIEEIPTMRETKTKGTAISFSALINILPNGVIQSAVNSVHPFNVAIRL